MSWSAIEKLHEIRLCQQRRHVAWLGQLGSIAWKPLCRLIDYRGIG